MTLTINIKCNSRRSISLEVNPEWTIDYVKEILSPKINIPSSEIRIIFAGKELKDNLSLETYDLSSYTTLHVIVNRNSSIPVASEAVPSFSKTLQKIQMPSDLQEEESQKNIGDLKSHFYVYCKFRCKDICPGKLRLQCSTCKQGVFTVLQDPSCWDDILLPNRIHGLCHTEDCSGRFAEFFFKCGQYCGSDENCVALQLIKPNYKLLPCIICYDISSPVLVFFCPENHLLCLECFRTYCFTMLNERRFVQHPQIGYSLPCPIGCEDSLIEEIHHFRILGEEQYNRYQRYGTEECLLQAGGVLCPRAGCGAGILPDREARRVECIQQGGQGCGFIFCRNCMDEFHPDECRQRESEYQGFPLDFVLAREARAEWQSLATIQKTTKPCPKCKVPTEKDGGCMHIMCMRPQCRYQWCWVCEGAWSRDCQGNHWFG